MTALGAGGVRRAVMILLPFPAEVDHLETLAGPRFALHPGAATRAVSCAVRTHQKRLTP